MRPPKPRITKPRLHWKFEGGVWVPYHRTRWTEGGKRRERAIKLHWKGDTRLLDVEYWQCESGQHDKQAPAPSKYTWAELIRQWRLDPRVQNRLADGTKKSYQRDMEAILEKNADKDVRKTTRQGVRNIHAALSETPRKADKRITTISLLWNYGKHKLDWPLGDNPSKGIDKYGKQREFLPWPEWMVQEIATAPERVRAACELILNTGQRPNAAITMKHADFEGDWMMVADEKGNEKFEVYCPYPLRKYVKSLPRTGQHIIAKNLTEPVGYDAVEKDFRKRRGTLKAASKDYSLHGLRKLAIIRLAEAGCTDAQIQSVTNQSLETIAYYRRLASRKTLSKAAMKTKE